MKTMEDLGREVATLAKAMSSPERVRKICRDQKYFQELMADLASFQSAAEMVKAKSGFEKVPEALMLAIGFISYFRHKSKEVDASLN